MTLSCPVLVLALVLLVAAQSHSAIRSPRSTFRNPILPGDWSDPALVRVGDDYYSLRSTFGWQPGGAIAHSKDLIHWEYIGYAYMSHPQIEPGDTGGGCWGAELDYNPNNGTFVAYCPIASGMWAYASKNPAGPYSEGRDLGIGGIDPGFFADDDGRLYITSARGKIWELAPDGLSVIGEVCDIGSGVGMDFEGPDIFRHDGWYYILYSSGGTRPHQDSAIRTIRSRSIRGPWEQDPNNPNMQAKDETGAMWQSPAHGTLVETPGGEWYVTYHAHENSHYSLGRQMCMDPIEWTEDGWWRPVHGRVPSEEAAAPAISPVELSLADSDEFDSPKLGVQWFFHTTPDFSGESWSLSERPGWLRVRTREGDISSKDSLTNVFLQRVIAKRFDIETKVEFDATDGREAAGLHMYHDPKMNFWLVSTVREGRKVLEVGRYSSGKRETVFSTPNRVGSTVYLKIEIDGEETATFYFSRDGSRWEKLGGQAYFGDSWHDLRDGRKGNPDLGWVGLERRNVWTGTAFGVFAVRDGAGSSKNADFDYIKVVRR